MPDTLPSPFAAPNALYDPAAVDYAVARNRLASLNADTAQQDLSDRATVRSLAPQLATGDMNALAQAATLGTYGTGAITGVDNATKLRSARQAQQSAIAASAAGSLTAITDAAEQQAAYPFVRQAAIAAGMDPSMLPEQHPGSAALLALRNSAIPAAEQAKMNADWARTDGAGPMGPPVGGANVPAGGIVAPGAAADAPGSNPRSRHAAPAGTFGDFLQGQESHDPTAVNAQGFAGAFQFGAGRLADLHFYTPSPAEAAAARAGQAMPNTWQGTFNIPGFPNVRTLQDFRNNVAAQQVALAGHVQDIDQVIASTPGAAGMSPWGLRAVAHLGGLTGLQRFIQSGGRYNVADRNGTRLSDYYNRGMAAEQAAQAAQAGQGAAPGVQASAQPAQTAPVRVADARPMNTATDAVPVSGTGPSLSPATPSTPAPVAYGQPAAASPPSGQLRVGDMVGGLRYRGGPPEEAASWWSAAPGGGVPNAAPTIPSPSAPTSPGALPVNRLAALPGPAAVTTVPNPMQPQPGINALAAPLPPPGGAARAMQPNALAALAPPVPAPAAPAMPSPAQPVQAVPQPAVQGGLPLTVKGVPQLPHGMPGQQWVRPPGGGTPVLAPIPGAENTGRLTQVQTDDGVQLRAPSGRIVATAPPNTRPMQERMYTEDRKTQGQVNQSVAAAQDQQQRLLEARGLLPGLPTGSGGDTRTAMANWINTYIKPSSPALAASFADKLNLPDAARAQEFQKIMLQFAGQQDKAIAGSNAGYQLAEMMSRANPGLNLAPEANRTIVNNMLVQAQHQQDYGRAYNAWVNQNGQAFRSGSHYRPGAEFDQSWFEQRNPQTYLAASQAMNGKPFAEWARGLDPAEAQRALGVVARIDPTVTVQGANGHPLAVRRFMAGQGG